LKTENDISLKNLKSLKAEVEPKLRALKSTEERISKLYKEISEKEQKLLNLNVENKAILGVVEEKKRTVDKKEKEVINLAVNLGLIKKGGAWFTLPDDTKYQGLEKVRIALLENIKMYNELYNKIKTMMGLK
ncbi:hypothetical protein LCGC14_2472620, partial [marine sediment metagenome]